MSGDHIRVLMYDDCLEITSPGRLPNIVTLENMKYTRWSRNPTIARTLVKFGWVRELNEEVQRIYDEMASYFLKDPTYSEPNDASVRLTIGEQHHIAHTETRRLCSGRSRRGRATFT